MCFVSSSTELIELFLLNSWELLGCGQMPLGTRCVGVYSSACVLLCVCHSKYVFHFATVFVGVCPKVMCVSASHVGFWSVSGVFSGLQASLVPLIVTLGSLS